MMTNGEVYAWGNNEHGQCGTGHEPFMHMIQWGPIQVSFQNYHNPTIKTINAGSAHSAFIDGKSQMVIVMWFSSRYWKTFYVWER